MKHMQSAHVLQQIARWFKQHQQLILLGIYLVSFFLSFGFVVHAGDPYTIAVYDGTQSLTKYRVLDDITNGTGSRGGFLVMTEEGYSIFGFKGAPQTYSQQFGLQGRVIGIIGKGLLGFGWPWAPATPRGVDPSTITILYPPLTEYFSAIQLFLAFITSVVATVLAYVVYKHFGALASFFFFAMTVASSYIILIAGDIYWIAFLLFLPFVLSWVLWPKCTTRSRKVAFIGVIFLAIFIKSLAGYEFVTSVILSAIVPIVYFDMLKEQTTRALVQHCISLIIAGIAGFFAALVVHLYSLYAYLGNWTQALQVVTQKAQGSTYIDQREAVEDTFHFFGFAVHPGGTIANELLYAAANRVVYEVQRGYIALPIVHLGVPLVLIEVIVAVICIWEIRAYHKRRGDRTLYSLCIATIVGWIASNSWAFLAVSHMRTNTMFGTLTFYIPFLLIAYMLISAEIGYALTNVRLARKKPKQAPG
jgi:hypothetical protein